MNTSEWYGALASVFWLGIQTSICPCPLATNVAAISYIGRRLKNRRETFWSGMLFALGQTATYLILSFLVLGLPHLAGDAITRFLTATFHVLVGPLMILIGMILSGVIEFSLPTANNEQAAKWVDRLGLWSALPLGILFALAFCPTTAAMFLTMLIVAAHANSLILFPVTFGLGLSLPVVFFAVLLALQVHWLGRAFHVLEKAERIARRVAGLLFIGLGLVLTMRLF